MKPTSHDCSCSAVTPRHCSEWHTDIGQMNRALRGSGLASISKTSLRHIILPETNQILCLLNRFFSLFSVLHPRSIPHLPHNKAEFHPEGEKSIVANFCNYRSYEWWEEIQNRDRGVRGESYAPPHDAISFLIVHIKPHPEMNSPQLLGCESFEYGVCWRSPRRKKVEPAHPSPPEFCAPRSESGCPHPIRPPLSRGDLCRRDCISWLRRWRTLGIYLLCTNVKVQLYTCPPINR
jgi:hypothetical protein